MRSAANSTLSCWIAAGSDILTLNALVAADSVLIPMQAEYFALEGVSELLDTIERLRQSFNPDLTIEGWF